jgi:hypothetical protein
MLSRVRTTTGFHTSPVTCVCLCAEGLGRACISDLVQCFAIKLFHRPILRGPHQQHGIWGC